MKYFDQVDWSVDPILVKTSGKSDGGVTADGDFTGVRTITTSTTVKSGAGFFNGITINNRIGQNIYIYDSTSKVNVRATVSQCLNTIGVISLPANNTIAPKTLFFNQKFTKGLIVIVKPITVTSVTDLQISYR